MALSAFFLAAASPPNPANQAPAVPLCTLVSEGEARARADAPPRLVSVTADIASERHHGLYLSWYPRCRDSVANVGQVGVDLPEGQLTVAGLEILSDRDFRAFSLGKRIYCTCVGEISYPNGYPHFVLRGVVRIWASRD